MLTFPACYRFIFSSRALMATMTVLADIEAGYQ